MHSLENNLISADRKTIDQTKAYWSKIDSLGADLWMSFSEIKDLAQQLTGHPVRRDKSVEDRSGGRPGCKSSTW